MGARETSEEIDSAAASWVVRADNASAAEQEALEAWLSADPLRRGAFVRAGAAWRLLARARALSPRALQFDPPPSRWRRVILAAAVVMGIAIGMALIGQMLNDQPHCAGAKDPGRPCSR